MNKEKSPVAAFIPNNRNFWSDFPVSKGNRKVLIEEPSVSYITHGNAVFTVILNQAKSLTPVWLYSRGFSIELLKSYVPVAEYLSRPKLSQVRKWKILLLAIWKFISMYLTRDILSFSYDGVKYGDIVYDSYLYQEKVATVRRIDLKMLRIIFACIRRHQDIRQILHNDTFEAVLVSQQLGVSSGVMLRTALRYGYKGYLRAGQNESSLQYLERLDEVYDFEYKPFPVDIETIITTLGRDFNKVYSAVLNKQVSGKGSTDGKYAFSAENKYYGNRESFVRDFNVDRGKKNVFVMIHAFNDNPHSHYRWMIFRDYYDWFIQTLLFAKKFTKVNWIFKQHPSVRFYPTRDVSIAELFRGAPENVIYIDEESQIDTRSLISCADVVITCSGSAGVELPAMARIPSVTAGDNLYAGLGFALEPKTRLEYFGILNNIDNIKRLSPEEQKRAQAAYLHINEFSRVRVSACLALSLEEQNDGNVNEWYWGKIEGVYSTYGKAIKYEVHRYAAEAAKPGFKHLNSLPDYRELILKVHGEAERSCPQT